MNVKFSAPYKLTAAPGEYPYYPVDIGYAKDFSGNTLSNITIKGVCVSGITPENTLPGGVWDFAGDFEIWDNSSKSNILYYMQYGTNTAHQQWNENFEHHQIPGSGVVISGNAYLAGRYYFNYYIGSDGVHRGPPTYQIPILPIQYCSITLIYVQN